MSAIPPLLKAYHRAVLALERVLELEAKESDPARLRELERNELAQIKAAQIRVRARAMRRHSG